MDMYAASGASVRAAAHSPPEGTGHVSPEVSYVVCYNGKGGLQGIKHLGGVRRALSALRASRMLYLLNPTPDVHFIKYPLSHAVFS